MEIPELQVFTRFGLGVMDREWLEHRLVTLSAVTAPSLLAQDDPRFHWVVLSGQGHPADIASELQGIVEPFGERASIHIGGNDAQRIARELSDGYVLTGRLDDDDAWSTTMVGAVRSRAASWLEREDRPPGVSISFEDGVEWVMYEMLDVEKLQKSGERVVHRPAVREYRLPFIGTSVFVLSPGDGDVGSALAGGRTTARSERIRHRRCLDCGPDVALLSAQAGRIGNQEGKGG